MTRPEQAGDRKPKSSKRISPVESVTQEERYFCAVDEAGHVSRSSGVRESYNRGRLVTNFAGCVPHQSMPVADRLTSLSFCDPQSASVLLDPLFISRHGIRKPVWNCVGGML